MTSLAYLALWVYVFSLPWERIIQTSGISIITRMTGGVALVVAVLAVVVSGQFRRWHAFHVAGFLFVLWAGCLLLALNQPEVPAKYWTFVLLFLVSWTIWEVAPSRGRQLGLLTAFVLGAYVAAFDTLLLFRTKAEMMRRFATGGADPNDSAMVFALALPMAWYLGMTYQNPIMRWICRGYLPVGLLALGLTGSRGGMITAFVGLLIIPLTMTRLSAGRRVFAMVLLSGSLVVAAVNTPDTLIKRLASAGEEVEAADLGGRFRIWKAGVNAFAHEPVVGYGTASFKRAVKPWGVGQVAHNSFLSVLVEQGAIGFVFYAAMFIAVFLSLLNIPSLERRFCLILMTTMVVAMLPLTWEDRKVVWFILSALLGLSQAWASGIGWVPQAPPLQAAPPTEPRVVVRPREPAGVRRADARRGAT